MPLFFLQLRSKQRKSPSLTSLSASSPHPVHPGPGPWGLLLPSSTLRFTCTPATLPDAHLTQALTIMQAWEG